MEQELHTFPPFLSFYAHQKQRTSEILNCTFSSSVTDRSIGNAPTFVVVPLGQAEETLANIQPEQTRKPQKSACFLLGQKVAKSRTVYPLLKVMRVILQKKQGPQVLYSFVVFYAPPRAHITFSQALAHSTFATLLNVWCAGLNGVALVDTGATVTPGARTAH
jgi:hypothetical protein